MVEQRQSALQRIQVGVIGLVVVLLFVSLANMVLDQVTSEQTAGSELNSQADAVPKKELPDEPLAELGVTPVAKDDEAAKRAEETPANVRPVPQRPTQ